MICCPVFSFKGDKELTPITSRRELLKQARNLLLAVPLGTTIGFLPEKASQAIAAAQYNYAAALQMSIYFYDAQKSGPGVGSGLLDWRGDSEVSDAVVPLQPMTSSNIGTNMSAAFISANRQWLDPTGKGTIDLSGGFHDAGDHVKFGLPQGYAISTLGWGFYEFNTAFVSAGQNAHMLAILRWGCDYLLRSTFRDNNGNVVAFAYQVGEGAIDHTTWAPPEVENLARPAYFATSETPASDVSAEAAAALAIMYLNVKASDATYAAKCLDSAKALYTFAVAHRGLGYSGGFYNSSYDDDDLAWAAIWLYIATNQASYLNDITAISASGAYTGYLKKIMGTTGDNWQNIWVHSWDTVWGGVFIKLAPITNDTKHWYIARWNLEYWASIPHQDPTDTNFLSATPAGFKVINTWGSCRYNTAAQLCALVYRKATNDARFSDWALGQMNYILGTNPMNRSYMVGFAANSAKHPHHRASHGSFTDSMFDPPNHRHTLWGGLVGGPDTKDYHDDATNDFVYNEVSIDYSAAFVGALAGHYLYYGQGQTPNASFSTVEAPITQYFAEALVNQENNQGSQITVRVHGDTSQPPHFETDMKVRYFFDISELLAAGQTISNVSVAIYYDQEKNLEGAVAIHGPLAWNGSATVYYVEFDWTGYHIWGTRDLEFGLNAAIGPNYQFYWNASNDWSRQGLTATRATTQYIPVYLSGKLVYGQEPPISAATPTPATTPTAAAIKAQFFAGDTGASTTTLRPNFQLVNTGSSAINLSTITFRYWYTKDGTQSQTWATDYAQVGSANIITSFVSMSSPKATADTYLQIGFTSGAGTLAAGQSSGGIQGRIYKSDYSSYSQTNDWSFNGTATSFTDDAKITIYQAGKLIYGTEPL
jgi:endoglucanase